MCVVAVSLMAVPVVGNTPARAQQLDCTVSCKAQRRGCRTAFETIYQTSKAQCTGKGTPERECVKTARSIRRAALRACRGFSSSCRTCCKAGGTACDVQCGDGVVSSGEECDPPGQDGCAGGAACSESCQCPPPPCSNGRKDGTETDVDCGGDTCGPCQGGKVCRAGSDCQSTFCNGGICTGPATSLRLTGIGNAVAGTQQSATVTAFDDFGNVAAGYDGTVHFASNDPKAVLPGYPPGPFGGPVQDYTFTAADAGTHTFANGVVLKTAVSPNSVVAVTDVDDPSLTSSQQPVISPAPDEQAVVSSICNITAPITAGYTLTDGANYSATTLTLHMETPNSPVTPLSSTLTFKPITISTDASKRATISPLHAGERDGLVLAELAKGTLRQKRTIPGVDRAGAETIIAEIGVDMSRFPSAAHLASWAGICPGSNESVRLRGGADGHSRIHGDATAHGARGLPCG